MRALALIATLSLAAILAACGPDSTANDPRILIGFGTSVSIERLTVHWPDGSEERFDPPSLSRYTTLVQGTGVKVPK